MDDVEQERKLTKEVEGAGVFLRTPDLSPDASGAATSLVSRSETHEETRVFDTKDPMVGSIVDGRYQLISRIGSGATSVVYKAEDHQSKKVVALKVLSSHVLSNELFVKLKYKICFAGSGLKHGA